MEAMQVAVDSALKRVPVKSEEGLVLAKERLQRAYAWLEGLLAGRTWAAGADSLQSSMEGRSNSMQLGVG
jgi:glutathione S-transferase